MSLFENGNYSSGLRFLSRSALVLSLVFSLIAGLGFISNAWAQLPTGVPKPPELKFQNVPSQTKKLAGVQLNADGTINMPYLCNPDPTATTGAFSRDMQTLITIFQQKAITTNDARGLAVLLQNLIIAKNNKQKNINQGFIKPPGARSLTLTDCYTVSDLGIFDTAFSQVESLWGTYIKKLTALTGVPTATNPVVAPPTTAPAPTTVAKAPPAPVCDTTKPPIPRPIRPANLPAVCPTVNLGTPLSDKISAQNCNLALQKWNRDLAAWEALPCKFAAPPPPPPVVKAPPAPVCDTTGPPIPRPIRPANLPAVCRPSTGPGASTNPLARIQDSFCNLGLQKWNQDLAAWEALPCKFSAPPPVVQAPPPPPVVVQAPPPVVKPPPGPGQVRICDQASPTCCFDVDEAGLGKFILGPTARATCGNTLDGAFERCAIQLIVDDQKTSNLPPISSPRPARPLFVPASGICPTAAGFKRGFCVSAKKTWDDQLAVWQKANPCHPKIP